LKVEPGRREPGHANDRLEVGPRRRIRPVRRPQTAIGDRVVLERQPLLQLRVGDPLLIVLVAGRRLLDVGDALQLRSSLSVGVVDDAVARHAEDERRASRAVAPRAHVIDPLRDALRRIAVHHVGVPLLRDHVFAASDSPPA
jgi:hypothetical protein